MRVFELIFPDHVDVEALKVLNEETATRSALDLSGVDESEVERIEVTPDNFGRIAAQTAKQVILQRIREAERDLMFDEYVDRVGELVTGVVQQSDSRYTLVELGRVEALLPKSEQIETERYDHGGRIKAVIVKVQNSTKGPQVILSRRSDELVRKLFELEVPEIADGLVEIKYVARETGRADATASLAGRCKIAVISHADGVDPVGACVGPRGSRVRMVVSELRGERIDIIPYNDDAGALRRQGALAGARARGHRRRRGPSRRRSSCPTTSSRWRSAKKVRTPAWRASSPAGASTSRASSRWPRPRPTWTSPTTTSPVSAWRSRGNGKRCPNMAEPGSRYCSMHADYVPSEDELAAQAAADAGRRPRLRARPRRPTRTPRSEAWTALSGAASAAGANVRRPT